MAFPSDPQLHQLRQWHHGQAGRGTTCSDIMEATKMPRTGQHTRERRMRKREGGREGGRERGGFVCVRVRAHNAHAASNKHVISPSLPPFLLPSPANKA
eukprot:3625127-Rhodomonas_salina.2